MFLVNEVALHCGRRLQWRFKGGDERVFPPFPPCHISFIIINQHRDGLELSASVQSNSDIYELQISGFVPSRIDRLVTKYMDDTTLVATRGPDTGHPGSEEMGMVQMARSLACWLTRCFALRRHSVKQPASMDGASHDFCIAIISTSRRRALVSLRSVPRIPQNI